MNLLSGMYACYINRLLQRLRAERRVQGGASVATTNSKSAEPLVDVVSILGAILTNLEDVTETSVAKPAAGNVSNTVVGAVQAARHSAAGEPFAATGVLQGVVLQLPTDGALLQSLLDSVRTSADVQAVIPDREVTAAVQQGTLPGMSTSHCPVPSCQGMLYAMHLLARSIINWRRV